VTRHFQLRSLSLTGTLLSLLVPAAVSCAQTAATAGRSPVLVELFTSEGCSSCPPADTLLAKLEQLQPVDGAEIIILSEHVDYWEQGGWHDRFSSHQYTDRQNEYATRLHVDKGIYTPQMVVDGTDQFVGNDGAHAVNSIKTARQAPKVALTLTNVAVTGHKVSASVSAPPFPFKGDLYAALVDPVDSTDVKGGENGGHHLQHAGVVRTMQRVGSLKDLAAGPRPFSLTAPSDAKPDSMRLVVFAQRSDAGPVAGIVSTPVTPAPVTTASATQE
jgi:hypothetical protein